ncbi:MAG: DUF1501 domain-containing protein, partial [Verrucomicrobiota bacterium]
MSIDRPHPQCAGTRREFLWELGAGFTGVALSALLERDGFGAAAPRQPAASPLDPRPPHRRIRAKSCIFLF